ncbi:sperm flagellar protein 1-like isoform X2 [Coccinella septempunctata]|uniref:sperm flagellar protein 1-like isoform X2 n=1 Tax=Coccinella septempunctata TaxID=41139 RepID=UPI001D0751A0|nr:sperm flagellar protein 1-like isoform X2 [Coccinella septempunctata]
MLIHIFEGFIFDLSEISQMENLKADFDYEEIFSWVDSHNITRQKRNVHRDFSDAVPLAEILKQHYPKLVDLHNYTPTNSYTGKVTNWETLNRKVLSKIRMPLSKEKMQNLAKSKQGVIENVLHEIKLKIESKAAGDQKGEGYYDNSGSEDSAKRKPGFKTIPIPEYEKLEKDLQEKEDTIQTLQQKLEHLESLVKIKDERINDLTRQLESYSNEDMACSSPRTRFFTRMF